MSFRTCSSLFTPVCCLQTMQHVDSCLGEAKRSPHLTLSFAYVGCSDGGKTESFYKKKWLAEAHKRKRLHHFSATCRAHGCKGSYYYPMAECQTGNVQLLVTPPANADSNPGSVKSQKPPGNRQLAASYHAEELGGQSPYQWPHRYAVLASPHQIDG